MDDHDERRRDRRTRTLKGGRIVYNRGYGTADCTVKNLSTSGAMIEMAEGVGLPSEFVLYIHPDQTGRLCKVTWRKGRLLGVAFLLAEG